MLDSQPSHPPTIRHSALSLQSKTTMRYSLLLPLLALTRGFQAPRRAAPVRATVRHTCGASPSLTAGQLTVPTAALRSSASSDALPEDPVAANGDPAAATSGGGTATIPNEIFNLVKSIVGAGVLSLPAGEFCADSIHHPYRMAMASDNLDIEYAPRTILGGNLHGSRRTQA